MVRITALVAFLLISINSIAQKSDDIVGKYRLPNSLDVEIYKSNNKYFGKIIALNGYENGRTTDKKNPDKSKRKDLLIGKVIVKDLEFDKKDKTWINGNMYGAEKGMIFNMKITKIDETDIEVVGSKFLFWKTLKWLKI